MLELFLGGAQRLPGAGWRIFTFEQSQTGSFPWFQGFC